jgi:hypothetical protein
MATGPMSQLSADDDCGRCPYRWGRLFCESHGVPKDVLPATVYDGGLGSPKAQAERKSQSEPTRTAQEH